MRPNLHLVLASPEPLSRDARERARAVARRHTRGHTEFREVFLNHGAREQPWSTLDPAERRLALESTLLYLGREVLELREGEQRRRRFEPFRGRLVRTERATHVRELPWLLLPQVTEEPLRLAD